MEKQAPQPRRTTKRKSTCIPTIDQTSRKQLFYEECPEENIKFPFDLLQQVFQNCYFCDKKGLKLCTHSSNDSYSSSKILLSKYLDANAGGYCQSDLPKTLMQRHFPIPDALKRVFVAVDVPHDNNCGYHALSTTLTLTTFYSKFLRRALYLFAKFNPDVLSRISKQDKMQEEKFMKNLLQDGVWLDVWGLLIASEFLCRTIIIYQKSSLSDNINGTRYQPSTDLNTDKPLYIYCHLDGGASHFVALFKKNDKVSVPEANFIPGESHDILKKDALLQYMHDLREKNHVGNMPGEVEFIELEDSAYERQDELNTNNLRISSNAAIKEEDHYKAFVQFDERFSMEDDSSWGTDTSLSGSTLSNSLQQTSAPNETKFLETLQMKILPKQSSKGKNFEDKSTDVYREAVSYFANEISGMENHEDSKLYISKVVKSFSPWLDYLKVLALKRKQKFEIVKKLATKMYNMQRSNSGRRIFQTALHDLKLDESLLSWYILESVDKWGDSNSVRANKKGEFLETINESGIIYSDYENFTGLTEKLTTDITVGSTQFRQKKQSSSSVKSVTTSNTENSQSTSFRDIHSPFEECRKSKEDETRSSSPEVDIKDEVNADIFSDVPAHLKVDLETLCNTFQLQKEDFKYQPDQKFVVWMDPVLTAKVFDYKLKRFIPHGGWPTAINRAFPEGQRTCSFSADHGVQSYGAKRFFCKMYGHCGSECGLCFKIILPHEPEPGKPTKVIVESKGAFVLMQSKSTSRQVRNLDRDEIKKVLERVKSKAVVLRNFNHISGLHALHRNHPHVSGGSLRQIKVEMDKEKLLNENPETDILMFKRELEERLSVSKVIPGFLQHINATPGYLKLHMFDERALRFHNEQYAKGPTKCFLDASGQFVSKVIKKDTTKTKEPFVYVVMGENVEGFSYPIAEMVSERGRREDIQGFLVELRRGLTMLRKTRTMGFATMCVVDWSYAMIGGSMQGLNDMEIEDYLSIAWKVLTEKKQWKSKKSCIFICTNHLMNATHRLFAKKIDGPKSKKANLIRMGLESIARLQECYSIHEFQKIVRAIVRTFGSKFKTETSLDSSLADLTSRKDFDELNEDTNNTDDIEFNYSDDQRKLREKSPFYQMFLNIEKEELLNIQKATGLNTEENPLYCPEIISVLRDHKVPLWPLWSASLPRASGLKNFLRASNATVESNFNIRKNIFMKSKRLMYNKYAREAFNFHDASLKEAIDKVLANTHTGKKSNRFTMEDVLQPEEAEEAWSKRKSSQRPSSYLTPTGTQHLSPQTPASVQTKRRDFSKSQNLKSCKPEKLQFDSATDDEPLRKFDVVLGLPRTAKIYAGKFKFLKTPRGIPNVGLSCYINSPLQCLLTLPGIHKLPIASCLGPYMEILYRENLDAIQLHHKAKQGRTETNVCFSLQQEQEEILLAEKTGKRPKIVREAQGTPQQDDAHDFLTRLLGLWDLVEIRNLFRFQMLKTLMCSVCNQARILPQESYYELSVEPNKSIKQAISLSTQEFQEIECNCGIDACNGNKMVRSSIPVDAPNFLLLRTEIFYPYAPWNKKTIFRNIPQFSETIDFKTQAGIVSYILHGLVIHSGKSREEGHYITYIRNGKMWLKYNDDSLTTKSFASLSEDEAVYLSFYVKS